MASSAVSKLVPMRRLANPAIFALTSQKLLRAASLLSVPVFVSTQNAARLGDTVPEIARWFAAQPAGVRAWDKTRFSMVPVPDGPGGPFAAPHQVVVAGIEAHICVTQTALDLLAAGHAVYVLADGVSSCNRGEVGVALARLRGAGAVVTTSEAWLYEVMGDAQIAEFKSIVGLVKETAADTSAALEALVPVSKM